jgi:hypothetical protein
LLTWEITECKNRQKPKRCGLGSIGYGHHPLQWGIGPMVSSCEVDKGIVVSPGELIEFLMQFIFQELDECGGINCMG